MTTSATVLRGRVISLDAQGRPSVEVPSLGAGYVIGPLEVATPSVVAVGARVVVASLSAVSEDLVVVGVIGAEAVSGGGGGGGQVEVFTFAEPASTWPLPHGFGVIPSSIVLVDTAGTELAGVIDHDETAFQFSTVAWGAPTAGTAYVFSGGGPAGAAGADGKSAYQLAVEGGFVGSLEAWLESLQGADGTPGGPGAPGAPGKSAYELAVINGFPGTQAEWLASLQGDPGAPGDPGPPGAAGVTPVHHLGDGNVARPAVPLVYWIGSATPVNATGYDWWLPEDVAP